MRILLTALVLTCLSLSGCSTIYRTVSLDSKPATSIDIDAKARMILVTDHGGQNGDRRVICAEPSPDTAVGLAASASAAAKVDPKVDAQLAATLAEAVQSIGRRTQTIQLLRDGLYRACEAYLNGAISQSEYKLLLGRISAFSITMVAIDGLTGGQGIQSTSITTKSGANAGSGNASVNSGASPTGGAGQPGAGANAETGAGSAPSTPTAASAAQDNVAAVVTIVKAFYELQKYVLDHQAKDDQSKTSNEASASEEVAKKP